MIHCVILMWIRNISIESIDYSSILEKYKKMHTKVFVIGSQHPVISFIGVDCVYKLEIDYLRLLKTFHCAIYGCVEQIYISSMYAIDD
jgi:hypothetical protein